MSIADVQRRLRELGRIRIGSKDERGYPTRLDVFRLTSPSLELLRFASGQWGGVPAEWVGAPGEGTQYELVTETGELEVYVPKQDVAGKQLLELYTKGGVQRRCDGTTELRSGRSCMCDPDDRACTPTTHVLFILPQIPDIGTWRLVSRGWNAAAELPATVDFLGQVSETSAPPLATLAIETRTSVVDGKTKHFSVPVLRVPYTLVELRRGGVPVLEGRPRPPIAGELPELPDDPSFAGQPPLGDPPALPVGDGRTEAVAVAEASVETVGLDELVENAPSPALSSGDDPDQAVLGERGFAEDGGAEEAGASEPREGLDVPTGETTQDGTAPAPPPTDEGRQFDAFNLLLTLTDGNLARAASYVNKRCRTSYTKKSIGTATLEELDAGILEAEAIAANR